MRAFFEQAKPVGVICHGPWTLVEADVVKGRTLTSWPSLKTDLENAGATWVDEEVHVDEGLTSSRNPDDLPAFCAKIVEEFAEGKHAEQARERRVSAWPPRSWTSTARWWTRTTTTRSPGTGRSASTGSSLPLWRIHRHIGMGGDQLVAALAGEGFDREHGDEVRAAEKVLYTELIGEVEPLAGARALIEDLKGAGHTVVLASSAKPEELEHYLTLLDARSLVDGWTDSGDVETDQARARPRARRAGEGGREAARTR